jgi:hypothetical protein
MRELEKGRPDGALKRHTSQAERAPQPTAHSAQEKKGEEGRAHEELVHAFREHIQQYRQKNQQLVSGWTDVEIIDEELGHNARFVNIGLLVEDAAHRDFLTRQGEFYQPIYHAWHVIAYDRQTPTNMHVGAHLLSRRYRQAIADKAPRPDMITLDSLQMRVLDALAAAVGIPRERGQSRIQIPPKLRDFARWQASGEYEAAVARQAAAKRGAS